MRKKEYSLRAIAGALDRAVSTISDELRRNEVSGRYDPRKAEHKAYVRRREAKYQGMMIVQDAKLRDFVERLLYDDQSPEAIAGRLRRHERSLRSASKDSIYRFIASPYGRRIESHRTRWGQRRRRTIPRMKPWRDRVFIDQRPAYINARKRVGDAEGDFIVSGKSGTGILFVLSDRKVRASFLERILHPSIAAVEDALQRIKLRYPEWHSMTTDNDILFRHHRELERILGIRIYFCHPYHAWEKGGVENANRYIRRYIPKRSDISKYAPRIIRAVEARLNRRIMAALSYSTPQEMMDRLRTRKKRLRAGKESKK